MPNVREVGLGAQPQRRLAVAPTPVERMERLGKVVGHSELWVKRDDNTGLAIGGNKARKLEFLVGDAIRAGCDLLITMGGPQSNHCRMTAAAAAATGLECRLVFNGDPISEVQGNMILDRMFGATWTFPSPGQTSVERMAEIAEVAARAGSKPYTIPSGGTNGRGILGYVKAAFEFADQCSAMNLVPSAIYCAAGSCGTVAGLSMGMALRGMPTTSVGISISRGIEDKMARFDELVAEASDILMIDPPRCNVRFTDDYLGDGYGIPTAMSEEAMDLAARLEGLVLDPVYTAKALSGMIGDVRDNAADRSRPVVFLHTGGSPALFAEQNLYWPRDLVH